MANKLSFVLLFIALIAFQHVSEAARRPITVGDDVKDENENELGVQEENEEAGGSSSGVLENDLTQAKTLIENDLREKESKLRNLEVQVGMLTKSEMMLNELDDAYKNGKNLAPFGKRLKTFNRRIKKKTEEVQYVSIIQSILKDLGLNKKKN